MALVFALAACGLGVGMATGQLTQGNVHVHAPAYPHLPLDAGYGNCTGATKQKALYLEYEYSPPLSQVLPLNISVATTWDNISQIRKYGSDGVFASHPFGLANGVTGYFGSQVTSDPTVGTLLFSTWDKARDKDDQKACQGAQPNATWCGHKHAFPLSDTCHRHCLDCGLHPGWHNTTGTQCGMQLDIQAGDAFTFTFFRSNPNTTYTYTLAGGRATTVHGSEWTLQATRSGVAVAGAGGGAVGAVLLVGKVFYEDTYGGLDRLSAFHEHIGCTPCGAFYESETRSGPWVNVGGKVLSPAINFTRPSCECELFDVRIDEAVPEAQFRTGPGARPSS